MYNFYGREGGRGKGGDEGEGRLGVACALYIQYRIIFNLHWHNSLWLVTTSQPRNACMHNHMH